MELEHGVERSNYVSNDWKKHIDEKLKESLKSAVIHRSDDGVEVIMIDDIGAIDSIEDGIVRCEVLDGNMLEVSRSDFRYEIEEGDVVNLKISYKDGKVADVQVLEKNDEEKRFRGRIMQERIRKMRHKKV